MKIFKNESEKMLYYQLQNCMYNRILLSSYNFVKKYGYLYFHPFGLNYYI